MGIVDDPKLMRLLTQIHDDKGLDLTQYKEQTLRRRIDSRLRQYGMSSYDEYVQLLKENPEEYVGLFNSLYINVTEFFRNPESFTAIEKIVIPRIIAAKKERSHKVIRAWSCACASGDEPYSLAMLLLEKLGSAKNKFSITVFGTDIDSEALKEAKHMTYTRERLRALGTDLLNKYFTSTEDGHYKLKSIVSDIVKFKHYDVIKDPPILHCDLILCRNLLIYFNKELQEETILKFFECLNPGGFLVLGMVESLTGTAVNHFEHVDNRLRIYRRPERGIDEKAEILSQGDIDRIVKEMLG